MRSINAMTTAKEIHIRGLVQGVGFRPFVHRLAGRFRLTGWVGNNNEGVIVHIEGPQKAVEAFLDALPSEAPPASGISSIVVTEVPCAFHPEFSIRKSQDNSERITVVSPDIAVCDECLLDMDGNNHRTGYPFINCTNCGPRFTIIRDLPYDRPMTSMSPFKMCESCEAEYNDILDRRYHAQPIACNHCGPEYVLHEGEKVVHDLDVILQMLAEAIDQGQIVAMKGLGGYHLACDALNEEAVDRLRTLKSRDGKPFAVMFKDMNTAERYTQMVDEEKEMLMSWRRPIMLLASKKPLAKGVSIGFPTLGAMLPYLPFHHLLFRQLKQDVIVLTSGNISDEPIIITNEEALRRLSPVTDLILTNNRDIHNRTDDSVAMVVNGKTRLIRRSRSWVPLPIDLTSDVDGILACGAELVNCFCIGKDRQAILSQHIGDLKNAETLAFYSESIERLTRLFRVKPELLVHDLHPDYLSTRYATESGIPVLAVQHHHAHIASCMAEFGLDEKVIGVSFDGTGLGTDGNIWGGEFLICDLLDFERRSYLDYTPMPGGDRATKEPWRMALSYLLKAFGDDYKKINIPFLEEINMDKAAIIETAIWKGINAPLTSSAGRLFDAVAALTGLCTRASFHAEAPMRLEAIADPAEKRAYEFSTGNTIDTTGIIHGVCRDISDGCAAATISARFHNSVINIIFAMSDILSRETGIRKVVLSGGTFQNKYMLKRLENGLKAAGYEVFSPCAIPANDGGIALGQLAVAAARRRQRQI